MSTLFSDNFSSYTPGSTNITNFVWENGGSPVVAFGTMTGSSSATGFYERSGQGLQIIGGVINENIAVNSHSQVNIMHWGEDGANTFNGLQVCTFDNANLSTGIQDNPSYISLVGFNINQDYTISFVALSTITGPPVYSNGVYVVTSTEQAFFPNTWQYYQMTTLFNAVVIASSSSGPAAGTYIGCSGTLAVDGTVVLVGTVTTSELISALYPAGGLNVNQWRFPGRFGYLRFLGDMSGYTDADILPTGSYTFGTSPIHTRLTQSVVEVSRQPAERNARWTQGVVEIPRKPAQRNVRWTQGVVEIIRRGTPGGWTVYET
jgi:hypothetical protein